jgi:hypothetical protein
MASATRYYAGRHVYFQPVVPAGEEAKWVLLSSVPGTTAFNSAKGALESGEVSICRCSGSCLRGITC